MVVTNKSIVKSHLNFTKFVFILLVIKLIISCKKKYFCAFSQILPLCSGIIHRSTYSLIAVRYTVIPRMMTKDCLRNR